MAVDSARGEPIVVGVGIDKSRRYREPHTIVCFSIKSLRRFATGDRFNFILFGYDIALKSRGSAAVDDRCIFEQPFHTMTPFLDYN